MSYFEFDPRKSALTKADPNRAIDFIEAQRLWSDPDRLEIPLQTTDEARIQLLGTMGESYWSVIFTLREENVRIISVRKMRSNEKEISESQRKPDRG